MLAWGKDCSAWDDAVDWANIEAFDHEDIPDNRFVMTTWHENVPLEDLFHFSRHTARHGAVELVDTLILHIAGHENRPGLMVLCASV